ncbi:MAG: hypothetical protein OEV78_10390 [Spirochaetia bacterium]|nr:hypothetical protein [Spirochaetia bacterium]
MVRLSLIAILSLGVRIFTAPSLCTHPVDLNIVEITPDEVSSAMMDCHEHENHPAKHIPCRHMKECLLDFSDDGSIFQKSVSSSASMNSINYAFIVPALSQNLYPASYKTSVYNRPPPEILYSQLSKFLVNSSFLI